MVTLVGTVNLLLSLEVRFTVRSLGKAAGMLTAPEAIPMPSITSLERKRPPAEGLETFNCSNVVMEFCGAAESVTVSVEIVLPRGRGRPAHNTRGTQRHPRRQDLGGCQQRGGAGEMLKSLS